METLWKNVVKADIGPTLVYVYLRKQYGLTGIKKYHRKQSKKNSQYVTYLQRPFGVLLQILTNSSQRCLIELVDRTVDVFNGVVTLPLAWSTVSAKIEYECLLVCRLYWYAVFRSSVPSLGRFAHSTIMSKVQKFCGRR